MKLRRPHFVSVPLAEGLRWRGSAGWIFQQKLDGCWAVREYDRSVLVGEAMKNSFVAFDCVTYEGQDVRRESLRVRLELLRSLGVPVVASGNGGEFLEAVLAAGGEGVVAKPLDAPWGSPWFRCKRISTHDVRICEMNEHRGTVRVEADGHDRGWVPVKRMFNQLAIGDVIEVAAEAIHRSGKFRSARVVRPRPDKLIAPI